MGLASVAVAVRVSDRSKVHLRCLRTTLWRDRLCDGPIPEVAFGLDHGLDAAAVGGRIGVISVRKTFARWLEPVERSPCAVDSRCSTGCLVRKGSRRRHYHDNRIKRHSRPQRSFTIIFHEFAADQELTLFLCQFSHAKDHRQVLRYRQQQAALTSRAHHSI